MRKILALVAVLAIVAISAPAFAAANPFMDVPANHWAYDAVAQLAAKGVLSGYPDGSYKGRQPATRYEMASALARALAKVDMEKASKQDVELLKKLVIEFKDELDALGVKVDKLDKRVAILEKDIGGWSLAGVLRFDAHFGQNSDSTTANSFYGYGGSNEFRMVHYRLFIRKRIDENTRFQARIGSNVDHADRTGGGENIRWEHFFVQTKAFWDSKLTVGKFPAAWEAAAGLYDDEVDSFFQDARYTGMMWEKDFGMASFKILAARDDGREVADSVLGNLRPADYWRVDAWLSAQFSENFAAGLLGYLRITDDAPNNYQGTNRDYDGDVLTYGAWLKFNFTPNIYVGGNYYAQSLGDDAIRAGNEDSPKYWRVFARANQEVLKFTTLKIEYGQIDNAFVDLYGNAGFQGWDGTNWGYAGYRGDLMSNRPLNTNTSKYWVAYAGQKWNDKWSTWLRYMQMDYDTNGLDDGKNYTVGVSYRYTPAITFEIMYDYIDLGNGSTVTDRNGNRVENDNVFRFRTLVNF